MMIEDANATRARERLILLKDMLEPQKWDEALAAERQVQPRDEGTVAVNPEPDAIRDVEVAEREVSPLCGHRAGVNKQRAIECPPRLPSVLAGEEQAVAILEAELAKTTKRLSAAKRGLKIKWHLLPRARVREVGAGMKRDRAIAIRDRHVLLKVDGDAMEAECVEILIAIVGELHPVSPPTVWMQRVVEPVEGDRCIGGQEIGLLLVGGNRRRIEDVCGRRKAAVGAGTDRWIEIREAARDLEQVGNLPMRRRAGFRASQQIVRPVLLQAVLTE